MKNKNPPQRVRAPPQLMKLYPAHKISKPRFLSGEHPA